MHDLLDQFKLQNMSFEVGNQSPQTQQSNGKQDNALGDHTATKSSSEERPRGGGSSNEFKSLSKHLLGSLKYQIFITLLTLYSLFSDDFRTTFFSAEVDFGFDIISLIVMSIFAIEIILSTLVIEGYFLSFFFFLDIVSTVSIVFDVNFITDLIFSTSATSSVAQLASQSKASRAATRAVRIVKLFRIIRIIKLYKNSQKAKEIKEDNKQKQLIKEKIQQRKNKRSPRAPAVQEQTNQAVQNSQNMMLNEANRSEGKQIYPEEHVMQLKAEAEAEAVPEAKDVGIEDEMENAQSKESKIGKILSELSIKKIIIVVLLMMFIIPLFSIDLYRDPENAWDYLLVNAEELLLKPSGTIGTSSIIALVQSQISHFNTEDNYIIQYTSPFNEFPFFNQVDLGILRNQDLLSSSHMISTTTILQARSDLTLRQSSNSNDLTSLNVILNQSQYNKKLAAFSMGKTLFICLILFLLMELFSASIDTLLVEPIEEMMEKLMRIAKDPESAVKDDLKKNIELETTIISNAIIKIGTLLSTVFGSAGAEIIGANIIQEGDMNPMIEGKKKCAFFGFCDIRNFTEITEVLQEEILIFVNKIGSLVHESVYRYGGSANKNIGEAFLLVWKIPEDKYKLDSETNHIDWLDRRYLSVLADFSLLGFIKTLIKLNKDPLVLEYGLDPRLQSVFGNYKVSMGFGLHVGWAIEGAIGSEYKIDASYLSPNVNMASRLEAATKQFGVDLLISEDLYELLTSEMKQYCRNIDRVTVKGSQKPIRLYTVDLCYDRLTPSVPKDIKYGKDDELPDSEGKRALNMEYLKDEELPNYSAKRFIEGKKQLRQVMVDVLPQSFKKSFELGVSNYLKGKWADSRLHLCEALKFRNYDGPTKTILSYMKKHNFMPPSDWKLYRPLTSK